MNKKFLSILLTLVLVLTLGLVTALPVAAAESEVWVDDDAALEWYSDSAHFRTIQEGIDAVDPLGTVNVAAGTYSNATNGEVFPLIINVANLTLTAGVAESTVIDSGVNDAIIITDTAAGVTVNGFTIQGGSPNSDKPVDGERDFGLIWERGELINIHAPATISNCVIDSSALHHGIMGYQTATIVNNTIGGLASGFGIKLVTENYANGGANGSIIENNRLEGQTLGIQIAGCDDITIKNNLFRNNSDPTPGDKWIDGCGVKLSADLSSISNVSITGNTFSGNDLGIMLEEYVGGMVENGQPVGTDTTITGLAVHQNNFEDNTNYGIATYFADTGWTYTITAFGEAVDATNNWWGDVDGPSHDEVMAGDAVSENVLYEPWLQGSYPPATDGTTTDGVVGEVTSVSPDNSDIDVAVLPVTITGSGFTKDGGATAVTFSGTGITVSDVVVADDTQITANLAIADNAPAGLRDVVVTYVDGTLIGTELFEVNVTFTLMAPSPIDLGLMFPDADNLGQSDPAGSVVTNVATWSVDAADVKATETGYMNTEIDGSGTSLAALFQISAVGEPYTDALTGITYTDAYALPFYVSQDVIPSDPAGSYSITITFTGWY